MASEEVPRLGVDALGVAQVAGVVVGDAEGDRVAGGDRFVGGEELADVDRAGRECGRPIGVVRVVAAEGARIPS